MDLNKIDDIFLTSLKWAEERDYAGWDPYDGLNSPILKPLCRNWLSRLIVIHGVNKSLINLRSLLRIPHERNPKGIALFASAYLNYYSLTRDEQYLNRAESLLNWLHENQSPIFESPAWGYNFDWQNGREFFLPKRHPNAVVTTFCGRAFLEHYVQTGKEKSLETAQNAADFLYNDINTQNVNGYSVYTYTPYDDFVVINVNALLADFLYQVSTKTGNKRLNSRSEELFEFVCDAQDQKGAWYYSMPESDSHLSHDNFHTGFVLESLYRYAIENPQDNQFRETYNRGLEFYRENLFDTNGAPRFEADKRYPYDAHAAAQAIVTFVQRGSPDDRKMAEKICKWSINNLYDKEGFFYRRIGRILKDKTTYMRWSQAWITYALSKYLNQYNNLD